jgi:hypothetical protein
MSADTLLGVQLDDSTLEAVAVVGAVTGVLGLLLALLAVAQLRRMRRAYAVLQGSEGRGTFVDAVSRHAAAVETLRSEVAAVQSDVSAVRSDLAAAVRHVAVVRYDAFGDMGGRMSFSAALLDDAGDGLVLTSINGRSETRNYAKGVTAGRSEQSLSPEEIEAVETATRTAPARSRR